MLFLCILHLVVACRLFHLRVCHQYSFIMLFRMLEFCFLSQQFFYLVFASFLEKLMVYFLIWYFKYFHFTWSSRMFSLESSFKVSEIIFFHMVNIFFVFNQAVLKFRKASVSSFLQYKNVIGKWSVKEEARTSVFLPETCMELEM